MGWVSLVVSDKIHEADETCSLRLSVPPTSAEAFRYLPGQFVHVRSHVDGELVDRAYSLSSAPDVDHYFQLTIKRIEGGKLSPLLVDEVSVGDAIDVSTPQGRFFDAEDGRPRHYLLIAAGSGVTPLFSILKWLLVRRQDDRVTLIFSSRKESSMIFRAELQRLEERYYDRLRVIHVLTKPSNDWCGERGRLDKERLAQLLSREMPARDMPEIAYLCGPEAFMDEAAEALKLRGLECADIRRESFIVAEAVSGSELDLETTVRILPEEPRGEAPAQPCETLVVHIDGASHKISVQPDETILAALLRHDIDAPFSCQEGTCLSCMCKVQDGAVRMRSHELIGLRPEDLGPSVVLACLSRPDAARVEVSFEDV